MTTRPPIFCAVHNPLVKGGSWIRNLGSDLASYSHVITATDGYKSAAIELDPLAVDVDEWLDNGLLRHIITYNEDGLVRFEGFVNKISANDGVTRTTVGPLVGTDGVVNRIWAVYAPLNTAVSPPTVGARDVTTISQDTDSQGRFGIVEGVISAGNTITSVAEMVRDSYLREHAYPCVDNEIGEYDKLSVSIECLGYISILDSTYYESILAGTQPISEASTGKLQDVLTYARAFNVWAVSSDLTRLTDNLSLVSAYENDDMRCGSLVKSLVALGDVSYNRYLFGIYENRVPRYWQAPTTYEYTYKAGYRPLEIFGLDGTSRIMPCDVMPGKWVYALGRDASKLPTEAKKGSRSTFIESVTYTMPYTVSLTSGKVNTLKQMLESLGLGGAAG